MARIVLEVSRAVLERLARATPISFNGQPDVLDPPFSFDKMTDSVHANLIVRTLSVELSAGTNQGALVLDFDSGFLQQVPRPPVTLLAGTMRIPFTARFESGPGAGGALAATLGIDLSATSPDLELDQPSNDAVAAEVGSQVATDLILGGVEAELAGTFRALGFVATPLVFSVTPGVASEQMMTLSSVPQVLALDADTLGIVGQYVPAPEDDPIAPLLDQATPSPVAVQFSADGFRQAIRNPAIRRLARDSVGGRHLEDFARTASIQRGGNGVITDADRQAALAPLNAFLDGPAGQAEIAAETPAPVGAGALQKAFDAGPFGQKVAEVDRVDLRLDNDRVGGEAHAHGGLGLGFSFTASIGFSARLSLTGGAVQLDDMKIADPSVQVFWDAPLFGNIDVNALSSGLLSLLSGAVIGFALAAVTAEIAGGTGKLSTGLPQLPKGLQLQTVDILPQALTMRGSWFVPIDDPHPFNETVRIGSSVVYRQSGRTTYGDVLAACTPILGIVMASTSPNAQKFEYARRQFSSVVTVGYEATDVPLPVTGHPWTLQVVYDSPAAYKPEPASPPPVYALTTGELEVTGSVWRPEPAFNGTIEERTFTIVVEGTDDGHTLHLPPEAAGVALLLHTKATDAAGKEYDLYARVPVRNETIKFGPEFDEFRTACRGTHRDLFVGGTPSLIDPLWNPIEGVLEAVQRAIHAGEPGLGDRIGETLQTQGPRALDALLMPSDLVRF